jgi:shikimate kinase
MRIYLIGFMASGKSTAGKRLAKKLGYRFIDLDAWIEKEIQMPIARFFEINGENEFRTIEKKLLRQTHTLHNTVIACGGGTPCFFDNIQTINTLGISIYLKVPAEELQKRLLSAKKMRPLIQNLTHDPAALMQYITDKLAQRTPYYTQAQHTFTHDTALLAWADSLQKNGL